MQKYADGHCMDKIPKELPIDEKCEKTLVTCVVF